LPSEDAFVLVPFSRGAQPSSLKVGLYVCVERANAVVVPSAPNPVITGLYWQEWNFSALSGGVLRDFEAQSQKIAAFGSSYTEIVHMP
jgi:hypothetical protein